MDECCFKKTWPGRFKYRDISFIITWNEKIISAPLLCAYCSQKKNQASSVRLFQMLQQRPGMIINCDMLRVRFHMHQLKINGTHSLCSQGGEKERKGEEEGGRKVFFHMDMSSWSPTDNYNHCVSVPSCHSPFRASWQSSPPPPPHPISCSFSWFPPWTGCPLGDLCLWWTTWHHQVGYCRFLNRAKMRWYETRQSIRLTTWRSSNINKCDFCSRTLLTLVIASYVRHQLQNAVFAQIHVEMFAVEQTPPFPGLACQTGCWSIERR